MGARKITASLLDLIRRILETRAVVSQRQLAQLLEAEGAPALSQPTLSRAMKRLGVLKRARARPYELLQGQRGSETQSVRPDSPDRQLV